MKGNLVGRENYNMKKIKIIKDIKIMSDADFRNWTGSAPELKTIGDYAYFENWTGSAPELKTIGGGAYFKNWTGSAPELKTIGGGADFRNWSGSAPELKSINKRKFIWKHRL